MSQETKWTMLNSCQHFYSKMVDLNIVLSVDWDKNQMFLFVGSSSIPFVLGRITVFDNVLISWALSVYYLILEGNLTHLSYGSWFQFVHMLFNGLTDLSYESGNCSDYI